MSYLPPSEQKNALIRKRTAIEDRIKYLSAQIEHCLRTHQYQAVERLRANRRLAQRDLRDVDDMLLVLPVRGVAAGSLRPLRKVGPAATHPHRDVDAVTEEIFSWGATKPEWKRPKRQVNYDRDELPSEKRQRYEFVRAEQQLKEARKNSRIATDIHNKIRATQARQYWSAEHAVGDAGRRRIVQGEQVAANSDDSGGEAEWDWARWQAYWLGQPQDEDDGQWTQGE